MKWTTSQVIAALAVLSPILSSWITNRLKLLNTRLSIKQAKAKRKERSLDELEKTFREYVKITYIEINTTKGSFSEEHEKIESRLLIYADDELYQALINLHKFIRSNFSPDWRVKELRKIILIFNKQFKLEQQKLPSLSKKLYKAKSLIYQRFSKLKHHKVE